MSVSGGGTGGLGRSIKSMFEEWFASGPDELWNHLRSGRSMSHKEADPCVLHEVGVVLLEELSFALGQKRIPVTSSRLRMGGRLPSRNRRETLLGTESS